MVGVHAPFSYKLTRACSIDTLRLTERQLYDVIRNRIGSHWARGRQQRREEEKNRNNNQRSFKNTHGSNGYFVRHVAHIHTHNNESIIQSHLNWIDWTISTLLQLYSVHCLVPQLIHTLYMFFSLSALALILALFLFVFSLCILLRTFVFILPQNIRKISNWLA